MRAVGTVLAALALLVAGRLVQGWLPGEHDDPVADPHVRTADLGEPVDLRTAEVTVESVTGSRTLVDLGSEKVSPGLWLVVTYTVVPVAESTGITHAEAVDVEGRTWGMVGRATNTCPEGPPGVPNRCTTVLEVPPDALPTLSLRLAREARDLRYDVVAEVDLGLTADDAAELASNGPLEVPPTGLGEGAAR